MEWALKAKFEFKKYNTAIMKIMSYSSWNTNLRFDQSDLAKYVLIIVEASHPNSLL